MDKKERLFRWYKQDLFRMYEKHGQIRMNVIEYICQFPELDPVEMARSLVESGCKVVFDDTSISQKENERKRRKVYGNRRKTGEDNK